MAVELTHLTAVETNLLLGQRLADAAGILGRVPDPSSCEPALPTTAKRRGATHWRSNTGSARIT